MISRTLRLANFAKNMYKIRINPSSIYSIGVLSRKPVFMFSEGNRDKESNKPAPIDPK